MGCASSVPAADQQSGGQSGNAGVTPAGAAAASSKRGEAYKLQGGSEQQQTDGPSHQGGKAGLPPAPAGARQAEAAFGLELAKVRNVCGASTGVVSCRVLRGRAHTQFVRIPVGCTHQGTHTPFFAPYPLVRCGGLVVWWECVQVIADATSGTKTKDAWAILFKCSELVCSTFGVTTCRYGVKLVAAAGVPLSRPGRCCGRPPAPPSRQRLYP